MEMIYISAGEFISENGRERFQLLEASDYNGNFYIAHAWDQENDLDCMIKFVEVSDESYKLNNLSREGRFQFHYPFIEQVYGNFHGLTPDGRKIYGVSIEFIDGQNLLEYRQMLTDRIENNELDEDQMDRIVFRQMMQFLNGMNYYTEFATPVFLHRDIKPENIMITKDENVKIVDFDYSHISGSDKTSRISGWDFSFSKGYSSPEYFVANSGKRKPDLITDIYSAGRVFFYWVNGVEYYTEKQRTPQNDGESLSCKPGSALYIKDRELRYGIEANEDRFQRRYLGMRYTKLRRILAKMCADPEKEKCYQTVTEIIEDMTEFLQDYCKSLDQNMDEYLGRKDWQLLQERNPGANRNARMVAWRIDGGRKTGSLLYEYTMRDVRIGQELLMTVYNLDQSVYYIPMRDFDLVDQDEHAASYRIQNKEILYAGGHEIEFSII